LLQVEAMCGAVGALYTRAVAGSIPAAPTGWWFYQIGRTRHRMYARYLEKHVRPLIGRLKAGAVDVAQDFGKIQHWTRHTARVIRLPIN
jgi:hypothetical protein